MAYTLRLPSSQSTHLYVQSVFGYYRVILMVLVYKLCNNCRI